MAKKDIPKEVLQAAEGWFEDQPCHLEYIGDYNGKKAYTMIWDECLLVGLPVVFLYAQNGEVENVYADDSLSIINTLIKD